MKDSFPAIDNALTDPLTHLFGEESRFFILLILLISVGIWLLLLKKKGSGMDALRLDHAVLEERLAQESRLRISSERECHDLRERQASLMGELKMLQTRLEAEREQSSQRLLDLKEGRAQLTQEFKLLAGEILDEKSRKFTEQNETQLRTLLDPLREKIQSFQGKVEEVYVSEGKERSKLSEQVRHLIDLNRQLSDDAGNLTRALTGQSKVQGDWGEMILSRLLDLSGLIKGIHYETQTSLSREDGTRAQPDVVLKLPEGRELVVDAKVSLTAYEAWSHTEDETERKLALRRHIDSVRAHVRGLSTRNYQSLYQLNSLDFVVLFVPIESAFQLAITSDEKLWQDAWEKNVLMVSSSTFLFVVRTLSHLWKQEQQSRNAKDIARRGGELFDKLCGFVQDLEGVGKSLSQAQASHEQAMKKLATGRGSVIRRAEILKDLGIDSNKKLPQGLKEISEDTLESEEAS